MVDPLIIWFTASGKGYDITSCGLKPASKLYADDGTLLTNSVEDTISLLDIIQQFSTWSSIHLMPPNARSQLASTNNKLSPPKRDRDEALRSRLAHVKLAGRPIGALTQEEPLPGGYIGTSITASLSPMAHLLWTKTQIDQIGKALGRTPLPPHKTTPLTLRHQLKDYKHSMPHGSLPTSHTGGRLSTRGHIQTNLELTYP